MIHSKIQLGLALMIALSSLCLGVSALHFEMVYQTKCVFEEVDFESSIAGYFKAFHKHDPRSLVPCDLVIEDPEGQEVFRSTGRAEESFYLSDAKEGEYKLCWTVQDYHVAQSTKIELDWSEGADATDWEAIAKRENLDAIHTELLRLEESIYSIHLELQHIRRKEETMRDLNELTNARVAWFSIGALLTCVITATLQFWSLRRFFKRKKVL